MNFSFNGNEYTVKFWDESVGNIGRYVSCDTETDIRPFTDTPNLVTFQAYSGGDNVYYVPKNLIGQFLNVHSDSYLLAQNMPFDCDVISKHLNDKSIMYGFYDNDLIRDVGVLYRLLHLAIEGFVPFKRNLALLSKIFLGVELVKDEVRESFGQFLETPLEEIPEEYLSYGAIDAIATYKIYFTLIGQIKPHDKMNTLLSQDIQVKGDLALTHMYKNGIGFDLSQRDEWLEGVDEQMQVQRDVLASWGWVRGKKGIKDVYERIVTKLGIADRLPRSEKSNDLSSKADDLAPFRKYQFVGAFLEYQRLEKATSFVRDITSNRIHPRYNLLVNTGRTSCSSPNFQQLPKLGGIREMFVADEGNTFIITDYSAIELATLAQNSYKTLGYSNMGDQINEGADLHKYYASIMNGCDIKDVTKQQRQEAKAANFGFPGGLGIDTFIEFSSGYGLELTKDKAQEMKDVWFDAFPEMRDYMKNERGEVFTLTGRKRGNTTFCAEKNTPFQGLAADGAKLALYELDKVMKIVGFCHDEIICEVPLNKAEELLPLQEKIMIDSMREVVPDVKIGVESMISDHYTK